MVGHPGWTMGQWGWGVLRQEGQGQAAALVLFCHLVLM